MLPCSITHKRRTESNLCRMGLGLGLGLWLLHMYLAYSDPQGKDVISTVCHQWYDEANDHEDSHSIQDCLYRKLGSHCINHCINLHWSLSHCANHWLIALTIDSLPLTHCINHWLIALTIDLLPLTHCINHWFIALTINSSEWDKTFLVLKSKMHALYTV